MPDGAFAAAPRSGFPATNWKSGASTAARALGMSTVLLRLQCSAPFSSRLLAYVRATIIVWLTVAQAKDQSRETLLAPSSKCSLAMPRSMCPHETAGSARACTVCSSAASSKRKRCWLTAVGASRAASRPAANQAGAVASSEPAAVRPSFSIGFTLCAAPAFSPYPSAMQQTDFSPAATRAALAFLLYVSATQQVLSPSSCASSTSRSPA